MRQIKAYYKNYIKINLLVAKANLLFSCNLSETFFSKHNIEKQEM